jgi:carnosine N-methyltransferase
MFPEIAECSLNPDADQNRSVLVPDMLPCQQPIKPGNLSMCAGDFVEVYGHPDQRGAWDAVVTCFFIDTAHNIVQVDDLS